MARVNDTAWLDTLVQLGRKTKERDGFLTTREMAKEKGIPNESVLKLLHKAIDEGYTVERRDIAVVSPLSGKPHRSHAYRVSPPGCAHGRKKGKR